MSPDAKAASGDELSEATADFSLGIEGFSWSDLHRAERLADLHEAFLGYFKAADGELAQRWHSYRTGAETLGVTDESRLLIETGRHVSGFLAKLFNIEEPRAVREAFIKLRGRVHEVGAKYVKKYVKKAKTE